MITKKEQFAIILDFLPHGYPFDKRPIHRKTAVAQAIGKETLVLLELIPKKDVFLQPHQEVYIGSEKREEIHHIQNRILPKKLTTTAKAELVHVLEKIINDNEQKFVEFFSKAGPINMRRHQVELLPGIGKRHMREILDVRRDGDFTSFENIKERVKLMPDPQKAILRRILLELEGNEKYNLFVKAQS